MNKLTLTVRAPLTEQLDTAQQWLRGAFATDSITRPKVVVRCPLSAVIGEFRAAHRSGVYNGREMDAIRGAELLMVAVHQAAQVDKILAVVIDPDAPLAREAASVMRKLGCKPVLWREGEALSVLAGRLSQLPSAEPVRLTRSIVYPGERVTARMIQRALCLHLPRRDHSDEAWRFVKEWIGENRKRYWFWHCMPLRRFLRCTNTDLGFTGREAELYQRWGQFDADLLVTTRAPHYLPLLVLEYDGSRHQDAGQHYEDSLRNELCSRAGLTLLRVSSDEVPPDEDRAANAPLRLLFESAIQCIAHTKLTLEYSDAANRLNKAIDPYYKRAVARAQKGKIVRPDAEFFLYRFLTMQEEEELFMLETERSSLQMQEEYFEVQDLTREAWEVHNLDLTIDRVDTGPGGSRATIKCREVGGRELGEVIGPLISFGGNADWYITNAQQRIAVGRAFERACTAYSATAQKARGRGPPT